MAVTHADLAPSRRSCDLGSKTGVFLMVLSILLGLVSFILCLVSEASRSQMTWQASSGEGKGTKSECTYSNSSKIPLLSATGAFLALAMAMVIHHTYLLVAVSKSDSLITWYPDSDFAKSLTWQAGFFFIVTWVCFAVGEILLLIGISVESGHLKNWQMPRESCLIIRQGLFTAAGVFGLIAVFLASGLYITALRAQMHTQDQENTRREIMEASVLYASPPRSPGRIRAVPNENPTSRQDHNVRTFGRAVDRGRLSFDRQYLGIGPLFHSPMRNQLSFNDEDQNELEKSAIFWWRMPEEFDENGHFKIGNSDFSNLTPRIKVIREMERLAFVAFEGLEDLRHKMISYRSGDFWLPVGGIKKEDMDIPAVVTILLAGISGSGKSSFVNLMYSVLGRSGLIPFAQTSGESSNYTTMFLEEHNVLRSPRSGFCVYDTRGLDQNKMNGGLEEVSSWMSTGVRHNQPCYRAGEETGGSLGLSSSRYVKRKVNCVMVVADLSKIHKAFICGDLKPVEALRDLFHLPSMKKCNENPILILTHGDTLNGKERINGRLKICEYLGISEISGAYDIPCLTEQGILPEESDPVTAFAMTEAIYRALLQSDRTFLPKKKLKDWIVLFLSWIMWCIASFFAILAHFFSKFGPHKNKVNL